MRAPGAVYPWEDGEPTREERRAALRARDREVRLRTIRRLYEEKAIASPQAGGPPHAAQKEAGAPGPPAHATTPAARGEFFLREAKRRRRA